MKVSNLIEQMELIAPTRLAESWDNVGLLVGDPEQPITKILLTIDYTGEVACEAAGQKADAIVAYHPPIFSAIKRITAGGASSLIFDAIHRGVAIYSPHTALDVAEGGTNDLLADALGLASRGPLRITPTQSRQFKFVTFVPAKDVQRLSTALFAAGAGRIGQYSSCSFRSPGEGTFFGEQGTNPATGQSGRLETAAEIRLETVVAIDRVEAVIKALRETHPYEEPAFDLVQLAAPPQGVGHGRIGEFPAPVSRRQIIERVKSELSLPHLLVAGPVEGDARRASCCAGACGDLLDDALAQKADIYLTGEMRHHDALKAARAGMTVLCTLHSNSERAVLARLQERLTKVLPGLPIIISQKDRDPFTVT